MNQSIAALEEFISQLELRESNGVTFFQATIHLLISGNVQVQKSEVHIITSDNLATVYITDLDCAFFKLPQLFEAKKQLFIFINNKYLKIEGNGELEKFTLSIYPDEK